jgi:hypothetical protein
MPAVEISVRISDMAFFILWRGRHDFRVGRRTLDRAMFVTAAEDVGLKSHLFVFFESSFGRSLYFMPNFQEIENRDANPSSVMLPVMASCGISR